MNRILIKGGTVISAAQDSMPARRDLLIEGERISRIDRAIRAPGARLLHAEGLVVAPGFIDVHSHSDMPALLDSTAQGRVADGVTTEINGNCGFSLFPLAGPVERQRRASLREKGIEARWDDAAGYFAQVESFGTGINRGFLVGHGAVRAAVMGYEAKAANNTQLRRMQGLLAESLEQGALGFSSGLCYPPGCFAEKRELAELCRPLARTGRPYCTHVRSEGRALMASVRESLGAAESSGASLHISHVKTLGRANWRKIGALERAILRARGSGANVTCDRYPYLAAMTDLASIFPNWLSAGGKERALARLSNRADRARLKKALGASPAAQARWDAIQISVATKDTREFEGLTVREAAKRMGLEPCEAVFELLLHSKMAVSAIFFDMCEENLERILRWPFVYIGSDSSARSLEGPTAEGKPHPRTFGSFARFLGEYVRRRKLISLPEAIARITSLPAARFGLKDRGLLRQGAYADIAVFDPKTIRDTATYAKPFSLSEGVRHLIVNGRFVLCDGRQTRERPGRVLRA